VDADFGGAEVQRLLDLKVDKGLLLALRDGTDPLLMAQEVLPNLTTLPSGPATAGSGELLSRPAMGSLVERLRQRFDMTVFDAAPVLAASDALFLAPRVDGVVLVVIAHQTTREDLGEARAQLSHTGARIIGVLLLGAHNAAEAAHRRTVSALPPLAPIHTNGTSSYPMPTKTTQPERQ
jgi:Mrp family chromosome partitioning ATPase